MLEIIQPRQTKVLVLAIHETIQLRQTELLVLDSNAWMQTKVLVLAIHETIQLRQTELLEIVMLETTNESISVSNPWNYTTEAHKTISVR